MPITLPVPGGGGATSPSTYYNGNNLGEYQFISLTEIIDNFQAAYVGEGKILQNVMKGDITFHAFRALQELHYDTVKSCKSQEIEVCPSLKMPLPHDYINYVKLAYIDGNGIEHNLYPARNTGNPFAIQQNEDCSYEFEDGDLMHQKNCTITSLTCSASEIPDLLGELENGEPEALKTGLEVKGVGGFWDLSEQGKYNYIENWKSKIDNYCNCVSTLPKESKISCGEFKDWTITDCLIGKTLAYQSYTNAGLSDADCADILGSAMKVYDGPLSTPLGKVTVPKIKLLNKVKELNAKPKDYEKAGDKGSLSAEMYGKALLGSVQSLIKGPTGLGDGDGGDGPGKGPDKLTWGWDNIEDYLNGGWPEDITASSEICNTDSDSWNRYKTGGVGTGSVAIDSASTVNASVDSSAYSSNFGERYGIDPQYAQGNGSYFIDCMRGNIHFSSNLAGRTIVLRYISDGVGSDDEAIVHKFAEEAMYKWIAYGCVGARADVPEYLVSRLKKERFAETRKAKIRLSNIKIEEISQVFRGKSKWIKH